MTVSPVFLDNLPDVSTMHNRWSEQHRLERNKALADLLLDKGIVWRERDCPSCNAPAPAQSFARYPLPFLRCKHCNTIFATRVPPQERLDDLRQGDATAALSAKGTRPDQLREFEFVSILNWIRLAAVRQDKTLAHVLDYRFSSHAPQWAETVARFSENRRWTHVPLSPAEGLPFADLAEALADEPDAVLLPAEIDRCADPAELLARLHEAARPGTLVFISSSCADGLEYEILGVDSPSFIPLDRLNIFSTTGFRKLVEGLGFRCLEVSTPGRLDALILQHYFTTVDGAHLPFWSDFFRNANKDRLQDLQLLLQRSLRSGVMRFVLETV